MNAEETIEDVRPLRAATVPSAGGTQPVSNVDDTNNSTVTHTIEKPMRVFKIIVIGDANVGKTCLTFRFCGGQFPGKTEATIGVDFRERVLEVDGELIKLQLWDTAGQERFRNSMVPHYYRNAHAVVFVYDVTKACSFRTLNQWILECDHHQLTSGIPRILVGNKCDCADDISVSTNVAQRFADLHDMPLFETSAKDDSEANHVEAIFLTLAHKLKTSKPLIVPSIRTFSSRDQWSHRSQLGLLVQHGRYDRPISRGSYSFKEDSSWCAC